MSKTRYEAFKEAWEDYPTQDNEGFLPDRAGFKCGFMSGVRWERAQCVAIIEEFKRNWRMQWREQLINEIKSRK